MWRGVAAVLRRRVVVGAKASAAINDNAGRVISRLPNLGVGHTGRRVASSPQLKPVDIAATNSLVADDTVTAISQLVLACSRRRLPYAARAA